MTEICLCRIVSGHPNFWEPFDSGKTTPGRLMMGNRAAERDDFRHCRGYIVLLLKRSPTTTPMKNPTVALRCIIIVLLLLPFLTQAQDGKRQIKLFLIGNSFSQDASAFLPQLAEEAGVELVIGRAELGGCSLARHWGIIEAFENNPDDPKGKSYKGKSLKELFLADTWDYVTIQQWSKHSTDVTTFRPYARNIYDYLKALQPDVEVLVHQTWAYRSDSRDWGRLNERESTRSEQEMYERSRESYQTIADELGVRILPVGDAFWQAGNHPKFEFQPDPNFDYNEPAEG